MNTAPDAASPGFSTPDFITFEAELDAAVRELALSLTQIAVTQARRYKTKLEAPDTPEASLHAEARSLVALVRAVRSMLPKSGRASPEAELPDFPTELGRLVPAVAVAPPEHLSRQMRRAHERMQARRQAQARTLERMHA